ncbi:unnamed protein product [Owenia fusiformis]|uniref:CCR4-NOT transcription complex subunit 3 n=1 Tax=Owenia fusiformis TaxID=6347 RepID=A0A8J1U550_OWEFU|nr:unnamed protein product [Owenia fusiformis]
MADRRKLQGEIDRCLKKVTEGVENFEDIWHKVQNATNSNQKEKYEADLKKEIKKLQRLRDQIKTWMASNDVKDKRVLYDKRKLIETQMERFKVVERETKTKAYSKEGLGAAAKLDPAQKEKGEFTGWISQCIDSLNIQMDQFESEAENLQVTSKKKKQIDKDKLERSEELKVSLEKHRTHVSTLEKIMRLVDNDALSIDQIKKIKDDIEYYIDSNQEPDFEENEFIYDDLDLDELDPLSGEYATSPTGNDLDENSGTPTSMNSSSPIPSPGLSNHSKDDEFKKTRTRSLSGEAVKGIPSKANSNNTNIMTTPVKILTTPTKQLNMGFNMSQHAVQPQADAGTNHLPPASTVGQFFSNSLNSATETSKPMVNSVDHTSLANSVFSSSSSFGGTTNAAVSDAAMASQNLLQSQMVSLANSMAASSLASNMPLFQSTPSNFNNTSLMSLPSSIHSSAPTSQQGSSSTVPALAALRAGVTGMGMNGNHRPDNGVTLLNGPASAGGDILHNNKEVSTSENMSSLKLLSQQAAVSAGLTTTPPVPTQVTSMSNMGGNTNNTVTTETTPSDLLGLFESVSQQPPQPTAPSPAEQIQQPTTTIHLVPLLGVAPLGRQPLNKEHLYHLAMLDSSYHHLPHPSDSERLRHYLPRNPCPTAAYYPQLAPPGADTLDFFQRLSTETLFFIFYYMEGTKAQYLAAKALKKQSWRFHTKYMMWFQRHEEPKKITEEYEQGTYIYFDYEKWGQRKKEGFTFEYRFLEDRD